MAATNYDMIKDLPGYKFILKAVLKTQIQLLVEQLATHTDEESVILTASVADGTLSHLGSDSGKSFLNDNEELRASFMRHCMEKHESGSEYYEPDFTEVVSHNGKTAEKPLGRFRHEPYPTSRIIKRRGSSASISSNGSQLSGFCNYGNKPLSHSLPENYNTESQLENFNPPDEMKSETFLTHCDYPYPKPETLIVKQTDTSVVKDEGDDGSLSGRRSIGAVSAASPFEAVDLRSNQSVGHGSEIPNMDFYPIKPGEEDLRCNICGISFKNRANRKSHMSIHTGERPHRCHICDKAFRTKSNLKSHLATHITQLPI